MHVTELVHKITNLCHRAVYKMTNSCHKASAQKNKYMSHSLFTK